MSKNLVIVESPAKAKTIEGYLGKDFVVKSSYGHIRDLPKGSESVDVEKGFEPKYVVADDKKQLVKELKQAASKAEVVWLATDEDREGEAISWHLYETLKLKPESTKRIVFSEITKTAILKSIENPRTVDVNLVNAQQARRILDRLVGFDLSPVLWKKVKPGLSAGRVQSVAVRIIVEREREIAAFKPAADFRVVGEFTVDGLTIKAPLNKRFKTEADANVFLTECIGAEYTVKSLVTKPTKRKPAAPFTTSTLQQEASRKLGFSVSRTMRVAQGLYESGLITYMRTDSTNLSDLALKQAKQVITDEYGDKYSNPKQYTGKKSKGAQEAHEAIRPSDLGLKSMTGERDQERLYDLIWKRTISSQMAEAELENTTATIAVSTREENFAAKGQVITFDGFLKVYLEGKDDEGDDKEQEGRLPSMKEGQSLPCSSIVATERFSKHAPRYTEASLVKRLEELGIGRPSTYAPTISTVQKRGYVEKGDREGTPRDFRVLTLNNGQVDAKTETENTGVERSKLFPTDIGMVVNDFLLQHFDNIMDFNFTAEVEEKFRRHRPRPNGLAHHAEGFLPRLQERRGQHPRKRGTRLGRAHLGPAPRERKNDLGAHWSVRPARANRRSRRREEGIRFVAQDPKLGDHHAWRRRLDLFKLPRRLGEHEGKVVTAAIGRFGPYVRYDGTFVSLKAADGDDPYTVTLARAIELIVAKKGG